MSFRAQVISLSSAGVLLLGLWLLGSALSPTGTSQRSSEALLFPRLRESAVQRIEIRGAAAIALDHGSGKWMLNESGRQLPASQERAGELLREAAFLPRGTLVTRSPQAAVSLGLGVPGTTSVVFQDGSGRTLAGLQVGNRGPGGQGTYLQAFSAPDVWLTGDNLAPYIVTDRRFWADLRILPADVSDALFMRLTVESFADRLFSWTVTREKDPRYGGQWGGAVHQDRVNAVVSSLSGLVGVDFAPPDIRAQILAHPTSRITVSLVDNRSFVILLGQPDARGDYPCTLADGELAWLVPQWREQELVRSPEEITGSAKSGGTTGGRR